MSNPQNSAEINISISPGFDAFHIVDGTGKLVSWVDSEGNPKGNLANGSVGAGFNAPLSTVSGAITGLFNDINKVFTINTMPPRPANLMLFLNGVYQIQGLNYSLSGQTITMAIPPVTGGQLVAI